MVLLEWDPEKAAANLVKHGVSFDEASTVFGDTLPPRERIFVTNLSHGGGHKYTWPNLDGSILLNLDDAFNDPMIDNKESKKRYRADVLVEDAIAKMEDKIEKEAEKATKRFGEAFDRQMFLTTNPRVLEIQKKIDESNGKLKEAMGSFNMEAMRQLILDLERRIFSGSVGQPGSVTSFSNQQDPVHVHDFHATILHLLGLDHERLTYRHSGRDYRLTDVAGNVVKGLLS